MGKGLSDLQKKILILAYQNRISGKTENRSNRVDLYTFEIKADVFGFEYVDPLMKERDHPGDHHFNESGKRYNSVKVSISKALKRLDDRGLITRYNGVISHWAGMALTAEGLELAKTLTAN